MGQEIKVYLEYIHSNMENCKIISSFSCLGKTYVGNKYNNVLDLEASWYKWIYYDDKIANDVEKRKGITDRVLNPEYPTNYFRAIKENILKYDVILITPEESIRQILLKYKISYYYAFPTNSRFVVNRALKRGNNEYFALGLNKSYKSWYPKNNENVLWVKEEQFLEDVLKSKGII